MQRQSEMNKKEILVFIEAKIVVANAELAFMNNENQYRATLGLAPAYGWDSFQRVIQEAGIDQDSLIKLLEGKSDAQRNDDPDTAHGGGFAGAGGAVGVGGRDARAEAEALRCVATGV